MNDDDESDRIVVAIAGVRYDVTDYVAAHPGEGHNDVYLEDYAGKDVTKEFTYYHSKQDKPLPQEMLQKVQAKGHHKNIHLVE